MMFISRKLPASAVLLILLVAPTSLTAQSHDVAALKMVMKDFTAAYETRNLDALMKTLADSDDVALFLPNPFAPLLIEGRAGARSIIGTFFESIPSTAIVRMTTHENTFHVYGDTAVNYNYTNIYLYVGGMSQKFLARTTNVFARKNGRWGIVHIHGTALPKESTYLTSTSGR